MANKTLFDFLYLKERLPFEIGGGSGSASIQAKHGSSFCSSSRPYLQNEETIDFAPADNKQSF